MSKLRSIGTEIEYCFPPSPNCSKQVFTVWRYRIKGHSDIADAVFPDGTVINSRKAETLDPIECKEYPANRYVLWIGKWTPIPPDECLHLLDAGWKALAAAYPQS